MTKHRIREIRAASKANSAHTAIIAEMISEIEAYQVRARRGEDLSKPAGELISATENPKKKARGTKEEIRVYAIELKLTATDAEWFFEKMTENDWKVSKQPVKDWKGRMRTWNLGQFFPSQKQQPQRNGTPVRSTGPATCIL